MINIEEKTTYVSPRVMTVDVREQAVLCLSGGINDMTIDPDGGDDFE